MELLIVKTLLDSMICLSSGSLPMHLVRIHKDWIWSVALIWMRWVGWQIGEELKLSRERVRQIETRALLKLRQPQKRSKIRDYIQGLDS